MQSALLLGLWHKPLLKQASTAEPDPIFAMLTAMDDISLNRFFDAWIHR